MATAVKTRRRRLRRSDCAGPGITRSRRGRGFTFVDARGRSVDDSDVLERIRALAIPPAWKDVWICPDAAGHLQATGIDAAGRKQYLYHADWQRLREREKFVRMTRFARALPRLRRIVAAELREPSAKREQVLACAARLLDVGLFRIGGEEYAEDSGGLGLATLGKEHVALRGPVMVFDYPGKGGVRRVHVIEDPLALELVRLLKRRRSGGPQLLAYRNGAGWTDVRSDEINDYLKQHMGEDFSAKDFRTWNATLLAAVALAAAGDAAASNAARKRAINDAVHGVAALLGNTPAVARRSYIDPRVIDRYLSGHTIASAVGGARELERSGERVRRRLERAVLDLLAG
jgi:DNA topoisomerase I